MDRALDLLAYRDVLSSRSRLDDQIGGLAHQRLPVAISPVGRAIDAGRAIQVGTGAGWSKPAGAGVRGGGIFHRRAGVLSAESGDQDNLHEQRRRHRPRLPHSGLLRKRSRIWWGDGGHDSISSRRAPPETQTSMANQSAGGRAGGGGVGGTS